jgi:predicted phosphodiesterase
MKFGIFGDIHSNFEALEAVVADMEEQCVVQPVCVGDVVGYNANPSECLEYVRAMGCPLVLGNHDEAATWELDPINFNDNAKAALQYTKSQLNREQISYLASLPLIKNFDTFAMVHAELVNPGSWKYVLTPDDATGSLERQKCDISFFGHTHIPHMFVHDGHWVREFFYNDFKLNPHKKYFVNVGSVGQPRDGDWRSSYVVYDTDTQSVTLRRVEYDIATTQKKIIEAGLPRALAERLSDSN